MAKRRRNRVHKAPVVQNDNTSMRTAEDGFVNSLAYLGEASELSRANDYERHSLSENYELLTVLYRENWVAARIIDTPCEDMTRSWYSLASEIEQEKLDELAKLEAKHSIKQELTNGLRWGRLYGGAAALIVIKGQEDMLDQPLDYDMIMPGSFRGLIVVDRCRGIYPSLELEEDMDDPEFGYPKYYEVNIDVDSGATLKIHHSRVLIFKGRMLPIDEEINEEYWGAPELEHVYEELQKRNSTSANIAQLIFQANVAALKMSDYGEVLGMGTQRQREQIYRYIQEMNRLRTSFGLALMSQEDSYEQHPYSFAGVAEVYETFMMDMAGAAEIPATKLFGRAPQGMNATGESDMKNYYEIISQLQERHLRPALEKLLPVMCMSLWGKVPEDLEIIFEPLGTTTPSERADIMGKFSSPIITAFTSGVITQRMALQELRETGKPINAWTNITDEDIEKASDEFDTGEMGGMEGMEGMMGGMPPMQEGQGQAPEMPEGEEPAPEQMPQEGPQKPDFGTFKEELLKLAKAGDIDGAKAMLDEYRASKAEDGGPGSGPRPGYKKNGSSLMERAKFMANPTAGMPEPKRAYNGPTGSAAQVQKANKEREDWSNLTTHQKIAGNAEENRHIRKMKKEVAKAAMRGDLDKAKQIVQKNRHYWANDPVSAEKVQSETLARQKRARRGFLHDFALNIRRMFDRDFVESEHPRGKGGKFVPKGSGSTGESEEGSKNNSSSGVANSPQTAYNTSKPSFTKTAAKKFRETFHAAKAAVEKERPQDSWRVDSTYTDADYAGMDCYTTPGGSSYAIHGGDIVSVCVNPNDNTTRGRDLLENARGNGGDRLDAYGGLYGFYIRNGFEPVSWCEWDDKYTPPGWEENRDSREPVIFYKYTGRSKEDIERDCGKAYRDFTSKVKPDANYGEAQKRRDERMKG